MAVTKQKKAFFKGDGTMIFQDVSQAIKAEKIVQRDKHESSWETRKNQNAAQVEDVE